MPLELRAEGFQLSANFNGLPSNGLAFGTIRVNEQQEKNFEISTLGKYPLRFKFIDASIGMPARSAFQKRTQPNPPLSEIEDQLSLLVNPVSGIVLPGAPIQVTVKCKAMAELNIQQNLDLRLLLFKPAPEDIQPVTVEESKSGEKKKAFKGLPAPTDKRPGTSSSMFEENSDGFRPLALSSLTKEEKQRQVQSLEVPISFRSVYSRFHFLPASGLNFGPLEVGTNKSRTFKLFNDGEFEFNFRLYAANDSHPQSKFAIDEKLEKQATAATEEGKYGKGQKPVAAAATSSAAQKKVTKVKAPITKPSSGSGSRKKESELPEHVPDLKIGAFSFTPASGQIPPGQFRDITVLFDALGSAPIAPAPLVDESDKVCIFVPYSSN